MGRRTQWWLTALEAEFGWWRKAEPSAWRMLAYVAVAIVLVAVTVIVGEIR